MSRAHALLFSVAYLLLGCETTTTKTVLVGDGGADAAPAPAQEEIPTDPVVTGSPHFARCKLACAPPTDGPCATGQDTALCITKCTTELDGFATACAECVVEHSGWAGWTCPATCSCDPCADPFGPTPSPKPDCAENGGDGPPPPPPTCTATCTGFELAKTSGSCASICEP